MIDGLKPYSAIKDSGISWLGKVPQHWDIAPAIAAYRRKLVKNTGIIEKTVLSLSYGRIVVRPPEKLHGLVPESFETYQIIDPDDIIVRTTDLQNDHTSLRIGQSKNRGIITSAYMCLQTTDRVSAQFGYQFLNAYDLLKIIYGFGSGLRQNLEFHHIKRMPVLIPPSEEQSAIIRFLGYADSRIRHYIAAKQRLIKLLEEEKRALIHRAVTRGLNANVRMKPSGVEWLGDVPEHWAISRVKNEFECLNWKRIPLSSTERGHMVSRLYDYYGASGAIDKVDGFIFDDELLLIAEDGANLVLRNLPLAIVARGKFWVNNHAHILRPKRGNIEYLAAVMEMLNYRPWISGAAQPKLTQDRLMSLIIAVPPPDEQHKIIEATAEKTKSLRDTIDRAVREIALLREYRTRLIADVVTGKLDVREAAANLPEIEPAAEPLDEIGGLPQDHDTAEAEELEAEDAA
jgi:type I restriction enzyme S subunit